MMERVDCKSMKELRFIDLSDNRLASIHGLDNCSHLLELCLSDNRVARLSGGLPKHSGLQSLDIDGNLLINCKVNYRVDTLYSFKSVHMLLLCKGVGRSSTIATVLLC